MNPTCRSALGALALSTAVAGMAGSADAATLHVRGAVVHRNARAHSFVVADRTGHLYAVHGRAPQIGRAVVVTATSLRDGTFALRNDAVGRLQRHVRVRGVVTFANDRTGTFTVSAPGVSMRVVRPRHAGHASDQTPTVGSEVVTTGTVDSEGDLDEQSVKTVGEDTGVIDLEGTVRSVDTSGRTITVSSDDDDQSAQSIAVAVPSSFDITRFTPGEEVELSVQPTGNGTATLAGAADDSSAQTADDASDEQGDVGDNQGEDSRSSAVTGASSGEDGGSAMQTGSATEGSVSRDN